MKEQTIFGDRWGTFSVHTVKLFLPTNRKLNTLPGAKPLGEPESVARYKYANS